MCLFMLLLIYLYLLIFNLIISYDDSKYPKFILKKKIDKFHTKKKKKIFILIIM